MSHLGRPDGKKNLRVLAGARRQGAGDKLWACRCASSPTASAPRSSGPVPSSKPGSVVLLENLRFHLEEEGKGKGDATNGSRSRRSRPSLTKLGDVYINDAFGTAHRAHASMVGVHAAAARRRAS